MARSRNAPRDTLGEAVKLRPADPFDLIRWLARSQGDPRKAVAELVQNSLDANAKRIVVERRRIGSAPALVVSDDGEGVLPEMSREEALRYLAQHIGHSRKAKLTPSERRERVIAGKYGVGLLGFWAIGRRFELRSRVGGSASFALCLVEDQPGGRIAPLPPRLDAPPTFTEAVVLDMHDTALRALSGARLAAYLGSELRGQLLSHDVELVVRDGMARGLAQKRFDVRPKRFLGERIELPAEIPSAVAGFAPVRVELYYARGEPDAAVQIACEGTVVAESVRELAGLEISEEPWIGREVIGVLDFADFAVPPGTRRGVSPDAAAHAFVATLAALRPLVDKELDRFARERDRIAQRDLAKELRRALRGFAQRLPQYELPTVRPLDGAVGAALAAPGARATSADRRTDDGLDVEGAPLADASPDAPSGEPTADELPPGVGVADAAEEPPLDEHESLALFAPGDLASARIVPSTIVLRPGRERRVRVDALDDDGRAIRRPLGVAWWVEGTDDIEVRGEGVRPALVASPSARVGAVAGTLHVTVEEDGRTATADATLAVDDTDDVASIDGGIPEPLFESDPRGGWRSRFDGARWVVNDAHEDWIALRADARARLRYILSLFAKDLVLRSFAVPGAGDVLDRMVEILAHAERNLRGGA
jgi:hypothetical protein